MRRLLPIAGRLQTPVIATALGATNPSAQQQAGRCFFPPLVNTFPPFHHRFLSSSTPSCDKERGDGGGVAYLNRLSASEIQQLLDEAGADYRDCLEKRELELRLNTLRPHLPAHVQYRLKSMLEARARGGGSPFHHHQQSQEEKEGDDNDQTLENQNQNEGQRESSSHPSIPPLVVTPPPHLSPTITKNNHHHPLSSLLTSEENLNIGLFQRCAPSVVHIKSIVKSFHPTSIYSTDVMEIPRGSGTGFCWDTEGHIVTNYHVIQPMLEAGPAGRARVTLSDDTVLEARLVGIEPSKDLAVLRIESPDRGRFQRGLHPITVGSSGGLHVGQKVLAIGNPFGLDQTLTAGIISGLGREIKGVAGNMIRGLIQTDAAINPGNSGGPLLDSQGRLIGVNTMIFTTSGSSAGIGFSIPSDTVRRVVNQLIRFGRVRKVGLGLSALPDEQAARLLHKYLPTVNGGVVVHSVTAGSGADAAGIEGMKMIQGQVVFGDVIVAVGGERVRKFEDLHTAVEKFDAGDLATITVLRGPKGIPREVAVRLSERVE